jgi:mono/diheme cytochrome c family protein
MVGPAAAAHAQGDAAPRTTLSGVYTAEQANRGRDVYAGMCQSCHTAASHTGQVFVTNWSGKPLSALFTYIVELMPKSEPGSLSLREYAQVLAFLLRMNGMPPGKTELVPDAEALKDIRIEVAGAPGGKSGSR